MRVLIGCEYSGVVRDAFIAMGHDAISCDFLPTDAPGPHYQGDVRDIWGDGFDLMIIHPDCTYVCGSGWHWNKRVVGRHMLSLRAIEFFKECMAAPVPKICAENPVGVLSSHYRKPDQYIQPYEYGHDASKKTGLWLKNLPLLQPTKYVEPRIVTHTHTVGQTKPTADKTDSRRQKTAGKYGQEHMKDGQRQWLNNGADFYNA